MEVVSETREHNMFTFPVLTYSLLYKDNKFQDESFARWCSNHNMKWSDSNFFVSDNVGVLSNCCRLLSNTKKLDAFINSIGGTALSVGSCRVSTINLVRIAYESKLNKKKYIDILDESVKSYRDDGKGAAKLMAGGLNLSEEETRTTMNEIIVKDKSEQEAYLGKNGELAGVLKKTADFLYDQKSLDKKADAKVFEQGILSELYEEK